MELLKKYQLSIMLILCGVCFTLGVVTLLTKGMSRKRKSILIFMEAAALLLLVFDRFSYIYKGNVSELGSVMVRIGNFMVFFMSLLIPHLATLYLIDLYRNEGGLRSTPRQLQICVGLFALGLGLLIVSQFFGLYYVFDAQNNYHRAAWYPLCYIIPFLIVLLQEWTIIQNRRRLKKQLVVSLLICIALPTVASVLQIFFYGVSLINLTMVAVVTIFYTYTLTDLGESIQRAKTREVEFYKEAREKESVMFGQTAEALANAIDAKDRYTRGHSTRVAVYSRQIASAVGLPAQDCEEVYFAALLHDVGKIGIPSSIINKVGKLSDAEFEQIKQHPILGDQILTSIKQAPFLRLGARHHHEHYDGTGYPDGLAGEDIPEIARIIAVADAYDAMTSMRSYREPLRIEEVKEEFVKGMGTQFDPRFAEVMLQLIEEGGDDTAKS